MNSSDTPRQDESDTAPHTPSGGHGRYEQGRRSTELAELLRERTDDIVSEALDLMNEARLEHYQAAGHPTVRERLAALLAATLAGLDEGDATPIITHTKRIAQERFEAGYDLLEVQTSINVMEETIWRRILTLFPPAEVARALGLVSSLFGVGKDTLACTYVSLTASREVEPSANVRQGRQG